MAESFTTAASLGQTTPVDRVRDSRRGAIGQEGGKKRPKRPATPLADSPDGQEPEDPGAFGDQKQSGKIVDIVI